MAEKGIVSRTPFLGRADELAWLERTLERARAGRPTIVVLAGEAGIGKTRLLREAARRARRLGFRSLAGASYEDFDEPFLPFIDALADVVHEHAASLPDCHAAAELLDVILGRRPASPPVGPAGNPDATQLRVLRVLTRAVFAMAREEPLLIGLDDLHWADLPSLRLLEHLALRLDDEAFGTKALRLVVVASARSDEHGPWEATLERLRVEAAVTRLQLTGLRVTDVSDLLREAHGVDLRPVVVRRLATMTGGNPLHLESLVTSLDARRLASLDEQWLRDAPLPTTLGGVIAEGQRRLSAPARRVMQVVAITSGEAEVELIAAVTGIDIDGVHAGLADCVDAGVLTTAALPTFSHPIQRHVCLAELNPSQIRALHAEVLAALHARVGEVSPERLARHALGAGDTVEPKLRARWVIDAGRRRLAATDWAAAAELFDAARALGAEVIGDPLETAEVELNAALCHQWTGRVHDLEERLATAAMWYAKAGSTTGVALSHLARVRAQLNTGGWGEKVDVVELESQLEALREDHPEMAALVQADLAMALWVGGRSAEAVDTARAAAELAARAGSPAAEARAFTVLGVSLLTLLDFAGSRAALEQGLSAALACDNPAEELMVVMRLPLVTGLMGDTRACHEHARRALELSRQLDASDAQFALATMCNLAGARGDFIAVEQTGAEVRSIARLSGSPWTEPFALAAMAVARALQGDAAGAGVALQALLPGDGALATLVADGPLHRVMEGYLAVLADDLDRAADRVPPRIVDDLLAQETVLGNGSYLAAVVEIARALDAPALAGAVLPALRDLVDRGQVLAAGMPFLLVRSVGLAERLTGDADAAANTLRSSLQIARREGLQVEVVRALLDLADAAVDRGDTRQASDLRAEAAASITELGMVALAGRAGIRPGATAAARSVAAGEGPAVAPSHAVVLFADISASTQMTEQLGDLAFRYRSRQAEAAMRGAVAAGGGRAIDGIRLGDGILAEFPSERGAVTAALLMIDDVGPSGLEVHVGVHLGEVIRDDQSIFGSAVNLAARVCDQAAPSQLLVSEPVAVALADQRHLRIVDMGERELKGVSVPTRLHAVERHSAPDPSTDPNPEQ